MSALAQNASELAPVYAEPADWIFHLNTLLAIIGMMGLYSFGVWLRSHVLARASADELNRQLLASLPVGLITMAAYGKTSLASVTLASSDFVFDLCLMAGYIIVFGMMSRETLDYLMKAAASTAAIKPS